MKFPQRALHDYLVRTTPKEGVIKKYAHAVTLAACGLIIPSVCAIFIRRQGLQENEPEWVWGAETLWKAHLGIVLAAGLLWVFERPKRTAYLPVDAIEDVEEES